MALRLGFRALLPVLALLALPWLPPPVAHAQGDAGFIRLVVNTGTPVEVFPAVIDEAEQPYLEFGALMRALEMPARYEPSLGAALGVLPDGTTRFELHLQRQTVLVGEALHPLRPEHYRLVDQTLYVRYSEVGRWLPVRVEWSVQAYQVRIRTDYPLPSLQREQRDARRRELARAQEGVAEAAELEREVPWFDPGMFQLNADARGGAQYPDELVLSLKGVHRFLKGDLEYSLSRDARP